MASHRNLLLLAFLLTAVAVSLSASAATIETLAAVTPNDKIIGSRVPGDRLIQREFIKKDASKLGLVVTVTKTFEGDRYSKITQIRALDQHTNGHGATASLISGGPGLQFVTMKFESERFRAIDFIVEVYGK